MKNVIFLAVMPNFATRVEMAFNALSNTPPKEVDENEFIDASRLVYDGVREIRRAVLMNRVSNYCIYFFLFTKNQKLKTKSTRKKTNPAC